ncbi:MAG: hypothetical protein UV60_C0015G0015 [Parcubacteria group bacterium GW2011_GWA2_43_11]|nr:MAG: hypothetical protein UV60_C0015G0015 [Parcubacteria group bacterium GW2011_GWA2_43_11]
MVLDVPYFKQENNYTCGAVTVQMLLRHHGIVASEDNLKIDLHTDKVYGTHHSAIINELTARGLYCYVNTGSTFDDVRFYVRDKKLPVLIHYLETIADWGHYALIVGYDRHNIFFNDPLYGHKYTLPRTTFLERWQDEKGDFPQWMLVAAQEPFAIGKQYKPVAKKRLI